MAALASLLDLSISLMRSPMTRGLTVGDPTRPQPFTLSSGASGERGRGEGPSWEFELISMLQGWVPGRFLAAFLLRPVLRE